MTIPQLLIALFISNLGMVLGAGIYEMRLVLPQWFVKQPDDHYIVNPDSMHKFDSGRKFWGFVGTVPLTLLTIFNLVYAFRAEEPLKTWWLAAVIVVLAERLATFTFFIPTAIRLQKAADTPSKQSSLIAWWMGLNRVRNLFTALALGLLFKAFVMSGTVS